MDINNQTIRVLGKRKNERELPCLPDWIKLFHRIEADNINREKLIRNGLHLARSFNWKELHSTVDKVIHS